MDRERPNPIMSELREEIMKKEVERTEKQKKAAAEVRLKEKKQKEEI